MRSIKPGRGPSFMSGIGNIAAVVFGIFWTFTAMSMGAPGFFPVFGVIFVFIGIAGAIYNFRNATSENRYSAYDITDSGEETDPLNARFGKREEEAGDNGDSNGSGASGSFCPYCGAETGEGYVFCKKCGRRL